MKLLVDAQLPRCLVEALRDRGHDALHAFEQPKAAQGAEPKAERSGGGSPRTNRNLGRRSRPFRRSRNPGAAGEVSRDLAQGLRTPDRILSALADHQERWVISKDLDFLNSRILTGSPRRLLLMRVGNLSKVLLERHDTTLVDAMHQSHFIEFTRLGLILHD